MRWDALEDSLREKVDEYWKEFYHDRYVNQALSIYSKDVFCEMSHVSDRRLFFDWFIHDYVIPDKKDTIIRLFIKEFENELLGEMERNTAMAWSESQLRFYEILEVKRRGPDTRLKIYLMTQETTINSSYLINRPQKK